MHPGRVSVHALTLRTVSTTGQGNGFMDINQDRFGWPSDLLDPETKTCRNEEKDQG